MVRVLQSLVVRLSSQQKSSLKAVRLDVPHVTGKEEKRPCLFSNKGGTTIFVLFANRGFYFVILN